MSTAPPLIARSDSDRLDRKRNFHTTELPQYDDESKVFPYALYAIDDGDEWLTWCEKNWPQLNKRDLQFKMRNFETQQRAIYELLDAAPMKQASFYTKFEAQLETMGESELVGTQLTLKDKSDAFEFYCIKKRVYDAKVAEHDAEEQNDVAADRLTGGHVREAEARLRLQAAAEASAKANRGSLLVPSTVGVAVSAGMSAAGDPTTMVTAAAKQMAVHLSPILPQLMPPDLSPLMATLATTVGGAANASMLVAGGVGILSFAMCKGTLYTLRHDSRRKARDAVAAAETELDAVCRKKRELEEESEEAERALKRARKTLDDSIANDTTGSVYEIDDEDEDEDRNEDEEEDDDEDEVEEEDEEEVEEEEAASDGSLDDDDEIIE